MKKLVDWDVMEHDMHHNPKIRPWFAWLVLAQVLTLIAVLFALATPGMMEKRYGDKLLAEQFAREQAIGQVLDNQLKIVNSQKQQLDALKSSASQSGTDTQDALKKAEDKIVELQKNITAQQERSQTTAGLTIQAGEITPYLSGVVEINCKNTIGSGSLWRGLLGGAFTTLTNQHVVDTSYSNGYCYMLVENANGEAQGIYALNARGIRRWNSQADAAVLDIEPLTDPKFFTDDRVLIDQRLIDKSAPFTSLNYSIGNLARCPVDSPIGQPMVMIGYPAYGEQSSKQGSATQVISSRTVTNGIISGVDKTTSNEGLANGNYFVSAKIDNGNSGGIALSKTEKGMCVLGIPTWLTVGNYETQGVVQNIFNVMQTK